jgi:FkbM family methyltransferase
MPGVVRGRLKRLYLGALNAQSGGQGLRATLPAGEIVRVLPEYAHLGWNPDEYRVFREIVKPGMTALDVGANAGAYALLLGQWVGRSGSVYAFEPAPDAFDGLRRHVELNDLREIVHPVNTAIGSAAATRPLLVAGTQGESRLAGESDDTRGAVNVAVTSIDEFCAQRTLAPAFIKIDVEGSELDVLRGARETIRRSGRELALFVEMHPAVWTRTGVTRGDILDELERQSLEAESIIPGYDPWSIEGISVRLRPV